MRNKIKKATNIIVKKIEKCLKTFYHKLPISHNFKMKAKNIFFTIFGFCLKNTPSYIIWKQTRVKRLKKKNVRYEEFIKFKFDKKIGVHLHLFYIDLLDEFMEYFNNIPYEFDLFVSIVDSSAAGEVKNKMSAIRNVKSVNVKVVANRGRDVAPFIVDFSNELLKYDYVCHVHSKKSLYTGYEQTGWRTYLLEGLMGSEGLVRNIFYRFETIPDVGLIYPETYSGIAYIGHSWLSNTKSRDELLLKLGIMGVKTKKYIDFPMGTMFWARGDAIKKFFKANIKTGDFPEENKQNDGTIAHAFERCLGMVIELEGYTVITYDEEEGDFCYGYGKKNMKQYFEKSEEFLKNQAYDADIVTSDIFDTLVMRKIVNPDDIFDIVEYRLKYIKNIDIQYKKNRKKAEKLLRMRAAKSDFTLEDIYNEFVSITGLSKDVCNTIMAEEINTEMDFLVPREIMVEAFNYIVKSMKQKTMLLSDMYFTGDIIQKILDKCGIQKADEIWISSEKQVRKDNGTMWELLVKQYPKKEILHIGDNEVSDAQLPGDRNIKIHHILSAKDLFSLTNIGREWKIDEFTPTDSVVLGLILNKYFNNPYGINNCRFECKIEKPYTLGYAIIGPVVADYLVWSVKKIKEAGINHILMLAREGYLFKKIFEIMKESCFGLENIESDYVYTSRRALLVASIQSEDDVRSALNIFYEGSYRNLLINRFGLKDLNDIDDFEVILPSDTTKLYETIKPKMQDILDRAEYERENYIKYMKGLLKADETIAVSDLGYSGSIQYYLSKLLKIPISGYYFATDSKKLPLRLSGNEMYARYIENDETAPVSSSYIHRYSLILEAVLTAPDNQLCYMDETLKPVFLESEPNRIDKAVISEIHKGATDFAKELFELTGDIILLTERNKNVYEELIRVVVEGNILSEKLKSKFVLEDDFCTDEVINIFDRLCKSNTT